MEKLERIKYLIENNETISDAELGELFDLLLEDNRKTSEEKRKHDLETKTLGERLRYDLEELIENFGSSAKKPEEVILKGIRPLRVLDDDKCQVVWGQLNVCCYEDENSYFRFPYKGKNLYVVWS